jgi:hypothetical protein
MLVNVTVNVSMTVTVTVSVRLTYPSSAFFLHAELIFDRKVVVDKV